LPLENVILVKAFGKKSSRVKKQDLIIFTVGTEMIETNFFVSPQLTNDAILGCQFMKDYGINLNVETGSFSYFRNNEVEEYSFCQTAGSVKVGSGELRDEEATVPTSDRTGQHPTITTADCPFPVTLAKTRDLQVPLSPQPQLTGGYLSDDVTDKASRPDYDESLTKEVYYNTNQHGAFVHTAASKLRNVSKFTRSDDNDDDDIKVFSPRGGYSTSDNASALISTEVYPTRKTLLVSSIRSQPEQESRDPGR
jgi:hypothetical protein